MFKTMQMNQKVFLGIAMLSFLISISDAHCSGSVASVAYTKANSVAASSACGAACAASVTAINAAKASSDTACNKAVSDVKTACDASKDTCIKGATAQRNACATMKLYVQTSTTDANKQSLGACNAAIKGTTACNAAWSTSYISCNAAHATDYTSCNKVLDNYVKLCVAKGATVATCTAEYIKAKASCTASANTAKTSCSASATKAQLSC